MSTITATAEHRDMTPAEYHAHPAWGASMLETFRRSRRECHAKYIARTAQRDEPSEAMVLGTLVHTLLLEPAEFPARFATLPPTASDGEAWNRRKPSHRDQIAVWTAEQVGKQVVDAELIERANAIRDAVLANWHARRLLERDGQPEFSIFWTDRESGLPCKCRIDWWSSIPLDLKTTCDPSPEAYARSLVQLGYHRKLAHYLDGIAHFLGEPAPLVHLAAGTTEPYIVATYDIDDRDSRGKSLGARQRRETLRQIAGCLESGDWREPWERQITSLRLPNWAFAEDQFQIGD